MCIRDSYISMVVILAATIFTGCTDDDEKSLSPRAGELSIYDFAPNTGKGGTQLLINCLLYTSNVSLEEATSSLEEVVVVAYGAQKKVTMTGSVASVNIGSLKTPVANLSNALQGKVAGIISVQSSGEPGYDNSTFTIRGIGTFTGNTSPLVDVYKRQDLHRRL